MRHLTIFAKCTLTALSLGCSALALAAEGDASQAAANTDKELSDFRLSVGVDFSEGKYGDTRKTSVYSAPVALKYSKGGLTIKVSTSFVHVRGPGSLLTTPEDRTGRQAADTGSSGSAFASADNSGSGTSGSGSQSSGGSESSGSGSSGSSGSGGSGSSGGGSGSSGSGSGSGGSGGGGSGGGSGGSGSGSGSSGSGGGGGSGSSGSTGSGTSSGSATGSGASGTPIATPGGGVIIPGGANRNQSGIGDTNVSLTYSFNLGSETYLDVSGKVKIPTASTAKRLGTGKVDFVVGAELSKRFGDIDVYAGGRRRFSGRTAVNPIRDTWSASAGAGLRIASGVRVGLDYDWQQSAFAGAIGTSEISGSVNIKTSRRTNLNLYAVTGTNRGSTDFGTGAQLTYRF